MSAPDSPGQPSAEATSPPSADAGETESIGRGRRVLVEVLIWGTTVLAVVAIFAVWSNRQLFNPDNWADTSTQLLENEIIRDATAVYLVDQLYENVDVAAELRAKLPEELQPLAAPVAGALRNASVTASRRALANAKVQEIWRESNRTADQAFVNIVKGREGAVGTADGTVTLDLSLILAEVSNRLGLPDVSAKLPPSAAQVTILESDNLKLVQDGGNALRKLALLLTIVVPLLYALAIFLARGRRRRTLMQVGIAIVLAGVVVLAGRAILISETVSSLVKNDANEPAATEIVSIATSMLREIAGAFVIVGIPLILAAWFAGPARLAVRGRQAIAPFLRDQPGLTFAITGAIMLLIFIWHPIHATGTPAGIIVFLALAFFGTEVLRRQTAREFPGEPGQEVLT